MSSSRPPFWEVTDVEIVRKEGSSTKVAEAVIEARPTSKYPNLWVCCSSRAEGSSKFDDVELTRTIFLLKDGCRASGRSVVLQFKPTGKKLVSLKATFLTEADVKGFCTVCGLPFGEVPQPAVASNKREEPISSAPAWATDPMERAKRARLEKPVVKRPPDQHDPSVVMGTNALKTKSLPQHLAILVTHPNKKNFGLQQSDKPYMPPTDTAWRTKRDLTTARWEQQMAKVPAPSSQYKRDTPAPSFTNGLMSLSNAPPLPNGTGTTSASSSSSGGGGGLVNLGNTCFFNAVLQYIRSIPLFEEILLRARTVANGIEKEPGLEGKGKTEMKEPAATTASADGALVAAQGNKHQGEEGVLLEPAASSTSTISAASPPEHPDAFLSPAKEPTTSKTACDLRALPTPQRTRKEDDENKNEDHVVANKVNLNKPSETSRLNSIEIYALSVKVLEGLKSNSTAVNPGELLRCISKKNPMFGNHMQHDAHEFFLEYINHLHDALLDQVQELPTVLFDSEVSLQLDCRRCHNWQSDNVEKFRDYSLDFLPAGRAQKLEELLEAYFQDEEREYRCPQCEKQPGAPGQGSSSCEGAKGATTTFAAPPQTVIATKKIRHPAKALALHLKRFKADPVARRYLKRREEVEFPERLDLPPEFLHPELLSELYEERENYEKGQRRSSGAVLTAAELDQMSEEDQLKWAMEQSERANESSVLLDTSKDEAATSLLDTTVHLDDRPVTISYRLASVVVHTGDTPHSGHYITWNRRWETKTWTCYNDSRASEFDHLPPSVRSQAYLLLYEQSDPLDSSCGK